MNDVTVAQIKPAPVVTARDYTPQQLQLIRQTVAKDCDDREFDLFIQMARNYGLDPFRRQIYAIVTNRDKADKRQLVCVVGIDGYRSMAARTGDYRPGADEPEIHCLDELKDEATNPLGIERAVVTVYKRDRAGDWHPVKGTAYWHEFAPLQEVWAENPASGKREPTGRFELQRGKDNWRRMPRLMIAKCAEAQALRKGWPEDLSGLHIHEEMHQADADATPSELLAKEAESRRLALIEHHGNAIPFAMAYGGALEWIPQGQIADRCMAFVNACDSEALLAWWCQTNQEGLRQFWAKEPSDALEVKKAIEAKRKALAEAAPQTDEVTA